MPISPRHSCMNSSLKGLLRALIAQIENLDLFLLNMSPIYSEFKRAQSNLMHFSMSTSLPLHLKSQQKMLEF